jgi:hypothetical protein
VHFALAGIGTYLLARVWGQSYPAAFFAAFIFAFSGQVLSLGNLYNHAACAAWIPWVLLATDRALESKRLRPWVLLTGVFSLQWLAAEPLTLMATFGLSFAYAFYRCGARHQLWSKPNFRLLAIFSLVGCGMLLLSAVQFLPASDLLGHSSRGGGLSFHETTIWSMNPLSFLEILMPDFSGSALAVPTGWLWLISDRNGVYYLSMFLGFVPLFFALVGWVISADWRRSFVAGAAGILLLLSFGHYTPVFALARLLLPPLTFVRFPIKLLVPVTFLVAILAGWGFDALRGAAPPWKAPRGRLVLPLQVFLGCTVLVLAVAWLAPDLIASPGRWAFHGLGDTPYSFAEVPGFLVSMVRLEFPGLAGFCLGGLVLFSGLGQGKKWARPVVYGLALLAMGQLVLVNSEANPTEPKSLYTYRPPVLAEFKEPPGTYRFLSLWPALQAPDVKNLQSFISFESIPAADGLSQVAQGEFQTRLQLLSGSMLYRVEGSINVDQERSLPPFLNDVKIYLERMTSDPLRFSCLLGRTNVRYILRAKSVDSAATRLIGGVFNGSPRPSHLYEDLCFVPRTYVAGNSLLSMDSVETLDRLASPEFDALNTAILAAPEGSAPAVGARHGVPLPVADSAPAVGAPHVVPLPMATSSPAVSGTRPLVVIPAKAGIHGRRESLDPRLRGGDDTLAGQVEIVQRDPNSVTLEAKLSRPGYVLLLDRYDPSWQATIDGREAEVWRANQIFRAVYTPAGQHEIRFYYRQRGLQAGLALSLTALAVCVVLCILNPCFAWIP